MKKIFAELTKLNKKYMEACVARESEIPGSYKEAWVSGGTPFVKGPQSNAAWSAAAKYRRDQEDTAVAAGVSPEVWKAASAGKHGLALSQCLPCLAEIEAKGLLTLLVKGEADDRGVSKEHAIKEIFQKHFPVGKEAAPKARYSMLNKRANCRAFAAAFLTNSTAPLKEVDRLFRPPEKGKSPAGGQGQQYKNAPVVKEGGNNESK